MQFPHVAVRNAVTLALSDDAAADDVTTRWSVAPRHWATAVIITRQPELAAGVPLAAEVYIATLTDRYVAAVRDLPVRVLDTRKTAPGPRLLDKYAVAAGGVTAARDNVRKNMASEGKTMAIEGEVDTITRA